MKVFLRENLSCFCFCVSGRVSSFIGPLSLSLSVWLCVVSLHVYFSSLIFDSLNDIMKLKFIFIILFIEWDVWIAFFKSRWVVYFILF